MANNPYKNFFGGYNSKKNADLGAAWEKQNGINNDPILAAQQKATLDRKIAAEKRAADLKKISDIKVDPTKLKENIVIPSSQGNPPPQKPQKKEDTSSKYTPNFETISGIKEFQRRNKLNPDGVVGKFTIGAMEKKGIVPAGTQAAFIEMQKPSSSINQAPIPTTPDNPNYVSPRSMQEAEDAFTARDMGITPTQLQQMRQVDAYGPNNPDKDAMYAQIFRPQTQTTAEAMQAYDASNAATKPQGWFDQVSNWVTRERTPEEKAAMRQQVYNATGIDTGSGPGLAERSAYN